MKKKWLSLTMCTVLTAGLALTGCGNGSKAEDGSASEKDKQVLTFYGFSDWVDSDPYKAVYQEVKEKFEKDNPDYTIELQSDPYGDWEQKYKTMFASGNPADIFMVNNPDFPAFANSGNVLNLDEYMEESEFEDFFDGVLGMYTWKDQHMALPFTTDCRILWYNKTLFEDAGLDAENPPQTWDELVQCANQITEKTGKYGFGMDLGLKEFPTASLMCASGSQIIKVDAEGKITPNVDTDEFRKYVDTMKNLKPAFEPDYANLNHHDVAMQFAAGQFGMIIGNTLTETDIYEKEWWGQTLIPTMTEDTPKGSFGGGFGICVSSETKAPEAAVEFAKMLCDAQYNAGLVSDIPASSKGLEKSEFATKDEYKTILEQIQYVTQTQPKTLFYSEIEAAAYDTISRAIIEETDTEEVVKSLEKSIKDIVSE